METLHIHDIPIRNPIRNPQLLELHIMFHEFLRQARHALLQHFSQLRGAAAGSLAAPAKDGGMMGISWEYHWI
jgi:ATP/maltotriose-dependent transcriptional regulator MalT